jgi:hypothetical protein
MLSNPRLGTVYRGVNTRLPIVAVGVNSALNAVISANLVTTGASRREKAADEVT